MSADLGDGVEETATELREREEEGEGRTNLFGDGLDFLVAEGLERVSSLVLLSFQRCSGQV